MEFDKFHIANVVIKKTTSVFRQFSCFVCIFSNCTLVTMVSLSNVLNVIIWIQLAILLALKRQVLFYLHPPLFLTHPQNKNVCGIKCKVAWMLVHCTEFQKYSVLGTVFSSYVLKKSHVLVIMERKLYENRISVFICNRNAPVFWLSCFCVFRLKQT